MPIKSGKLKGKKKKGTKGGKKRKAKDAAEKKPEVDILSPAAMLNAQYICHNVQECLQKRGFAPPGAAKKKKGKKGKKKSKK